MKYIYGPIKSRRLGLSLGVSLSADKVCDLDCVYCQWGSVGKTFLERKEYARPDDILYELRTWIEQNPPKIKELDYVTFSGLGEPTLSTALASLIPEVRKITHSKIAVITNSTLFGDPAVRKDLLEVDLVVPSLDAVNPEIFRKIDRPDPGVNLDKIIQGLIEFRKEFKGKIWLEIMLVAGINDDLEHIEGLKKVIDQIRPDIIQLNSPVRHTAQKDVFAVSQDRLIKIKNILGQTAQII